MYLSTVSTGILHGITSYLLISRVSRSTVVASETRGVFFVLDRGSDKWRNISESHGNRRYSVSKLFSKLFIRFDDLTLHIFPLCCVR